MVHQPCLRGGRRTLDVAGAEVDEDVGDEKISITVSQALVIGANNRHSLLGIGF